LLVVHATKKLRDRLKSAPYATSELSPGALGAWYATAVFWRPQVALFVNEVTLLPVLVTLAPAATVVERFAAALAEVLVTHGASSDFVADEIAAMAEWRVAKTANRSVVGVMHEFAYLGKAYCDGSATDLHELSVRLSATPCGPLFQKEVSPDGELRALLLASNSLFHTHRPLPEKGGTSDSSTTGAHGG
jgi:hypothetical protein